MSPITAPNGKKSTKKRFGPALESSRPRVRIDSWNEFRAFASRMIKTIFDRTWDYSRLEITPHFRLIALKATLTIGSVCAFCLSPKLWLTTRLFPLSPIVPGIGVPFPLDWILFIAILGLLITIAFDSIPRRLIFIFLALAAAESLADQTRWQPWFYQYFFMFVAIGLYGRREPAAQYEKRALNICSLIIAFTYVWSGLQKLNANFVTETWPDIAGPFIRFFPRLLENIPRVLTLSIPILEVVTGLALISRRYRNRAVLVAILTHVFVLMLLISSGENTVVWPWNIVMMLLVVILFWHDRETTWGAILKPKSGLHALVLLLFAALPAFSFADLWDSYLSAALYSGNTDQAVILVSPEVVDRLPQAMQPHIWRNSKPFFLDINRWAYGELNVPVYPEPRVYKRVAQQICKYGNNSPEIKLLIKQKPNSFTGRRQSEYYDCNHLD